MNGSSSVPWGSFSHDPRHAANARLRASDRDRDVVVRVLSEAYADGRLALASPDELREQAVARYQASRRHAFSRMVVPTVVTFVIWFAAGWHHGNWSPGLPWPLFVALGTGLHLLRILLNKQDIIEEQQHKLERERQEALEPSKRGDES